MFFLDNHYLFLTFFSKNNGFTAPVESLSIHVMRIIDAHAHAFRTLAGFGADGELRAIGNGKAMWATGDIADIVPEGYGDRDFTAESLLRLMDENGIEKAVLLQGGLLVFDNHYLYEVKGRYPERFQAAATLDPFCRSHERILHHLIDDLGFKVFKFEMSTGCGIMGEHPDFPLDAPFMMDIYREIAKMGGVVAFDLGSPGDGSNQPEAVRRIADSFPDMKIAVCHLMSPRRNHREQLINGLTAMNRENIYFDLAALHWKVRPEEYPFPTAQEFIRTALDIIGADRLMWGTDVPTTIARPGLTVQMFIDYIKDAVPADSVDRIFYSNAERLYFGGNI